jgi:hypothetical protein
LVVGASTSTFFITLLLPPLYRTFGGFGSVFRQKSDPFEQVELGSDDFLAKLQLFCFVAVTLFTFVINVVRVLICDSLKAMLNILISPERVS